LEGTVWQKGVEEAKDRKGRIMLKTAFGDQNLKYGWNKC
jgi:hypothetical protein